MVYDSEGTWYDDAGLRRFATGNEHIVAVYVGHRWMDVLVETYDPALQSRTFDRINRDTARAIARAYGVRELLTALG